eukprot:4987033-Amphidinium_carterae.1
MAIDPKPESRAFMMQNGQEPEHLFSTIEEVLKGSPFDYRQDKVVQGLTMNAAVLVAGFPCSPFSNQRGNKHLPGQG